MYVKPSARAWHTVGVLVLCVKVCQALRALHGPKASSPRTCDVGTITPILQMRKPKYQKVPAELLGKQEVGLRSPHSTTDSKTSVANPYPHPSPPESLRTIPSIAFCFFFLPLCPNTNPDSQGFAVIRKTWGLPSETGDSGICLQGPWIPGTGGREGG